VLPRPPKSEGKRAPVSMDTDPPPADRPRFPWHNHPGMLGGAELGRRGELSEKELADLERFLEGPE